MRPLIRKTPEFVPTENTDTVKALKGANVTMALQAVVMFALFLSPTTQFSRPVTPTYPWWLSVSFGGVEVWDLVFPVAAALLVYSTATLRGMTLSHLFSFVVWFSLGMLWLLGGLILGQTGYLFAPGLFAIFVAALHLSVMNGWRAEGVR